jgi:methylated-DNA-[protein]-cysteine S-methyltransferase
MKTATKRQPTTLRIATISSPVGDIAVARANATNPIGIVIPCHRVIGADGALRGYGGGLDRKAWLLEHERAAAAPRAGDQMTLAARYR